MIADRVLADTGRSPGLIVGRSLVPTADRLPMVFLAISLTRCADELVDLPQEHGSDEHDANCRGTRA